MAKIRSAWEIALEKTQDIEIDREKLERDEVEKKARLLAGKFLSEDEDYSFAELKSDYEKLNEKYSKEGIKTVILQNLSLPSDEYATRRYGSVKELAGLIASSSALSLLDQIVAFLSQYPKHREQLVNQLKEHFAPMLEEKARSLREKYGQDIPLSLENDKEFMQVLSQQLEALEGQYSKQLEEAKEQLSQMLG